MARRDTVQKSFTFEGKRYYVRGDSEKDAIAKRALLKEKLEAGRVIISRDTLVKDWIEEWITSYKEGKVNDRWLSDIQSLCRNYITPAIGYMKLGAVKPIHLQKIFKNTEDKSNSFNAKLYDILKQIFKTAQANRLIEYDPMMTVEKPWSEDGTEARRSITDYERKITLKVAEQHRGGLFILIMLYCGLRPQEIVPLQWCDIDFEHKRIRVYKALKSDGTIKPVTKTASGKRDVPIPNVFLHRLQEEKKSPFELVCTNTLGERLTKSSYADLWKSFKREMQINAGCKVFRNQLVPPYPIADDLTLYCYRHTYCTDLQAAGVPINVAKELMGHSDISITAKIYTHKSEVATQNAADLINAYVDKGVDKSAQPIEKCANKF